MNKRAYSGINLQSIVSHPEGVNALASHYLIILHTVYRALADVKFGGQRFFKHFIQHLSFTSLIGECSVKFALFFFP